jgi:Domain of unknown function (DUF4352)
MRYIALALLLPALLGPIATITTADRAIAEPSSISKSPKFGPWQFSVHSLASMGRTMKQPGGDGKVVEASGEWVVAQVRIKNATNSRQSIKNAVLLNGALLIGANGKKYEFDLDASGFWTTPFNDHLEDRPFNPGEARTINLVFDAPKNEGFQRLEIPSMKSMANIRIDFK